MRTNTFVLSEKYPDCTVTTYIHEPSEELAIDSRRAIIVCPGGAFEYHSDREAEPIALQYFAAGLNVFLLRYSVKANAKNDAPMIESALLVKHIREHAEEYFVDPKYVFITGFSAGGHVAASCGTMWNDPAVRAAMGDAPEGINRPTATLPCYAVISGGQYAHRWSIDNLCGGPSEGTAGADRYSMELHVDSTTSPAFLWHTFNDACVSVMNSVLYAEAMIKAGVPVELHIYPDGNHALALCNKETWSRIPSHINPTVQGWIKEAIRYVTEFEVK